MTKADEMRVLANQKCNHKGAKELYEKVIHEIEHVANKGEFETICNPWYTLGSIEADYFIRLLKEDGFKTEPFFNNGGVRQLRIMWN
ncbi:MAG: hypothetical protein MJZ34_13755 [Paludibacteraceae bacterium]|nr:hypothetical protein [Paludibacteraceae bacterium]